MENYLDRIHSPDYVVFFKIPWHFHRIDVWFLLLVHVVHLVVPMVGECVVMRSCFGGFDPDTGTMKWGYHRCIYDLSFRNFRHFQL